MKKRHLFTVAASLFTTSCALVMHGLDTYTTAVLTKLGETHGTQLGSKFPFPGTTPASPKLAINLTNDAYSFDEGPDSYGYEGNGSNAKPDRRSTYDVGYDFG